MATLTWIGGNGNGQNATAWDQAANWSPPQSPATRAPFDDVVIASAANQPTLNVNASVASLTVDLGASLTVDSQSLTITAGRPGAITLNGPSALVTVAGGSISGTGGLSIGSGSTLSGFGTVNVSGGYTGTGTILATGGILTLGGAIGANSGLGYGIDTASVLSLAGPVGGSNTFGFLGTSGALELSDVTVTPGGLHFAGSIARMDVASSPTPDLATTDYINVQTTITRAVLTDSSHIELLNGATDLGTITLATATTASHVDWFADSGATGSTIGSGYDIVLSDQPCFAAGTRLLTIDGEKTVESLTDRDVMLTLDGDQLVPRQVKWIGSRRIDLTAHPRPETVAPVQVCQGAFNESMPSRDLVLSPDHAVFVDGTLIAIRQLLNGSTIRQEHAGRTVAYFHVELDSHAILLAEGLPAESYLNTGNHGLFSNGGEPLVLHPDLTAMTDYASRAAGACAPFVWDEASVRPVWQRLADRAAALGRPFVSCATTADPALSVRARGRTLRPLYAEKGLHIFALPKGATELLISTRAAAPAATRPWLDDRRCLGIRIERIVLRGSDDLQEIPLDHPGLTQGWWTIERDGIAMRRWTDGNAVLPLPPFEAPAMLEIRAATADLLYPIDVETAPAAPVA